VRSIAAGQGANCGQWSDPWCVTWPSNAGFVFVHPKSRANQALALAVVTDRRVYSLVFEPLAVRDARQAIYRLRFTYPAAPPSSSSPSLNSSALAAQGTLVAERNNTGAASVANAAAQALPVNANYTIAYGRDSMDLRPALVFDDGRFTYLKWSGNREIPAVFEIRADGSEMVANTRMQGDLLVVDRIARGLMLRSGSAVASIHNEAFEPEGHAPIDGTTALGLARILKE
jgi:type IV secretion system protein VirB9